MSQYRISKLLNRFQIHHANIYYHAKFQSQGWLNTDFMKGGWNPPPHTCQIFKTPYHIGLRTQELSIVSQMLHLQLALQIGELEQLTIRSENRCERDWEKFITSNGKNLIPFEHNTSGNPQRSAISVQRI